MTRRGAGFTLIELLFVMAIMGFVLAVAGQMAMGMLRTYNQQGKAAESNIEGILGLEIMRRDIENAGYGLPWDLNGIGYAEATDVLAQPYNDAAAAAPPRAIASGNNVAGNVVAGSDYLVIKAVNVSQVVNGIRNDACNKWTYLLTPALGPANLKQWGSPDEDLLLTDRVAVMRPGTGDVATTPTRVLVAFPTTAAGATAFGIPDEVLLVYGLGPAGFPLRMPFNRADYYVSTIETSPGRCAPGTGTLVKAVVRQDDGSFNNSITPLLECVADMQVSYRLDRLNDGVISTTVALTDLAAVPLTAAQIRDQLREISVYILVQEGEWDSHYMHPVNPVLVGETVGLGRNFVLTPAQRNYKWKVYTLVVRPSLMR